MGLIAPLLVLFGSYCVLQLLRLKGTVATILCLYVCSWAQVVLAVQLLSLVRWVTPGHVLGVHLLFSAAVFLLLSRRENANLLRGAQALARALPRRLWRSLLHLKDATVDLWPQLSWFHVLLGIVAIVVLITTLFLALGFPENNHDSMSYHLPRAAYWLQHRTIDHYETYNEHQNGMPVVAEIGILWTMLFTGSDRFASLTQWSAFVVIVIALYGICRERGQRRVEALGVALLVPSLSMFILQAHSALNDLVLAAMLTTTVYFILAGLNSVGDAGFGLLALAGLSFGLFVGTKGTALLFLPGLVLWVVGMGLLQRRYAWRQLLSRWALLVCSCLIGCLLFCSYNWILNTQDYGNPFLYDAEAARQRVEAPDLKTAASSMMRTVVAFYDLPWPMPSLARIPDPGSELLVSATNSVHDLLGIDISSPRTTWDSREFALAPNAPSTPRSYFGPLGFVLIWPSLLAFVVLLVLHVLGLKRSPPDVVSTSLLCIIPLSFFVVFSVLLKWQPWLGRLYVGFVALALPCTVWLFRIRRRWLRYFVHLVVGAIVIYTAAICTFGSREKPLIPFWGESMLSMSPTDARLRTREKWRESYEVLNKFVSQDARLGLMLGQGDWEFPYFGSLSRYCIPLPATEAGFTPADVVDAMTAHRLDAVLARSHFISSDSSEGGLDPDVTVVRSFEQKFHLFLKDPVEEVPLERIDRVLQVDLADRVRLLGYDLVFPDDGIVPHGEDVVVRLYWSVLRWPARDFVTQARLASPGSQAAWGTSNGGNMGDVYPPAGWEPNEIVVEQIAVNCGTLPAGDYVLQLTALDAETAAPLPWRMPDREEPVLHLSLPDTLTVTDTLVTGSESFGSRYAFRTEAGDGVALHGYALYPVEPEQGGVVSVDLYWDTSVAREPDRLSEYAVFLHLLGDSQEMVSQDDQIFPAASNPEMSQGAVSHHEIEIPEGTEAGEYVLAAGLYHRDSGQRASLESEETGEDAVVLTTLAVR